MRGFVTALLAAAALAAAVASAAARQRAAREAAAGMPMSGVPAPGMASFDRVVPAFMEKWQIPGGAVAVVKDGRLVLARGYGWADREARRPVEPESLFRIASLSKSITAAAVLELVEAGKLSLDDKAFQLLSDLQPAAGAKADPRIHRITVRNLLNHTGGWDSDKSFDPMFSSREIVHALGVPAPARPRDIIRYMLGKPLQFAPGTRYAYSNFGYCVLGRIVEKVTGQSYGDWAKAHVLARAGSSCMRLARTLARDRAPREARYYGYPGIGLAQSVFPNTPPRLPWPYGGWSIEAMDAHGGWLASAVDLARFVCAVDPRSGHPQLLRPQSIAWMTAPPPPPAGKKGSDNWYGMGWQVRPVGTAENWWHGGSLDGTTTIMVKAYNGITWVALFNSRAKNSDKSGGELDDAMWRAVNGVTSWPERDLFDRFAGCPPGR